MKTVRETHLTLAEKIFSAVESLADHFPTGVSGLFLRVIRKVKIWLDIRAEYSIGEVKILLPPSHLLPFHQRRNLKYDKFLPHLVSFLQKDEVIVDVGANCADTLAGMISKNIHSHYVCIEPDEVFFDFLSRNIQRIKESTKGLTVYAVKSLVSNSKTTASLEGKDGTKHAVFDIKDAKISSEKLDDILSKLNCSKIRLLKTDVDGFDYDVIYSSKSTLIACCPLLFFECQYNDLRQYQSYKDLINWLSSVGYEDWVIFDNFGEIVLRTGDKSTIFQLFEYVWMQNINQTTRTIFYYDILACGKNDSKLVENILAEYKN